MSPPPQSLTQRVLRAILGSSYEPARALWRKLPFHFIWVRLWPADRKRKPMGTWFVRLFFVLHIATCVALYRSDQANNERIHQLRERGVYAPATVTAVHTHESENSKTRIVHYQFQDTRGDTHQGSYAASGAAYVHSEGDPLEIRYLSDEPSFNAFVHRQPRPDHMAQGGFEWAIICVFFVIPFALLYMMATLPLIWLLRQLIIHSAWRPTPRTAR